MLVITDSKDTNLSKLGVADKQGSGHAPSHGVKRSRTRLSDGTELMVFPVVTYRCDTWPIKKAEH